MFQCRLTWGPSQVKRQRAGTKVGRRRSRRYSPARLRLSTHWRKRTSKVSRWATNCGASAMRGPPGGPAVCGLLRSALEQGPILEDTKNTIGVVTGARRLRWYDVVVTAQDAHAGPTPMHLRKDSMLAASRIAEEVNRIALAHDNWPRHSRFHASQAESKRSSR